jgi:saccharopepsin
VVPSGTTVPGAPGNKAVVLMDSGSSYTYVYILYYTHMSDLLSRYAPKAICDAIYYNITGAQFDVGLGQWVVPCDYELDMALQIGYV